MECLQAPQWSRTALQMEGSRVLRVGGCRVSQSNGCIQKWSDSTWNLKAPPWELIMGRVCRMEKAHRWSQTVGLNIGKDDALICQHP